MASLAEALSSKIDTAAMLAIADAPIDHGLRYLKARFPDVEAWPISAVGNKDFVSPERIRASPALVLLKQLQ